MNQLFNIRFYLFLPLLTLNGLTYGQQATGLHKLVNLPHVGDSIVKQQVDYVDPGIGGTNVIWNFQLVKPVNDYYNLKYQALNPDTNQIAGIEHNTIYRYEVKGDSLYHTGYENSTTLMNYYKPELKLSYPFSYGDSIRSYFLGEGEYCNRIKLHVAGKTKVIADAMGTLNTPLGLSFKKVLRIKSFREYTQTGLDSVSMTLESYAWYVQGNRYPIFETVKTSTKKADQKGIEHKVASFFYPPIRQATLLADTSNWSKTYSDKKVININEILINYRLVPNPVQSQLTIEYDIKEDASVSFVLYDNLGKAKIIIPPTKKIAGHNTESMNLNGFLSGFYPLTVTVNNMVKTLKVMKR
jgi:hypothetical protein